MARRIIPSSLLVLGTLVAFFAIVAIWVSRQALETDQWTQTSSKLLEQPAIRTAVSGFLVNELYANVDVTGELKQALPPQAQALAGPAAGALRSAANSVTEKALETPRVQEAWKQANRQAHTVLVKIIDGGGPAVKTNGGTVTLDLKGILQQLEQTLGVGGKAAAALPAGAATVTVFHSDQLKTAQTIGRLLKPLAAVLVLVALAFYGGAIALSSGRRRKALRAAGFGFVLAGIGALVARKLAGDAVVNSLATTESIRPAIQATWTVGTSLLVGVAAATIAYGIVIFIGAWLAGPTRLATGIRATLAPYLRDARLTYGVLAGIVLLLLLWAPTEAFRRVLPAIVLIVLLALGVEALRREVAHEFPPGEPAAPRLTLGRQAMGKASAAVSGLRRRDGGAAPPPADESAQLERLDELHRSGALDDEEFTAAKQRVLARH